jgi:hypothetical protein
MIPHVCCLMCMASWDLFVSAVLRTRKRSMMTVHETLSLHLCRNLVFAVFTDTATTARNYMF